MILLWGLPEEKPLAAVHDALLDRKAETLLLDQRRALATRLTNSNHGRLLSIGCQQFPLAKVTAIYPRPYPTTTTVTNKRHEAHPVAIRHTAKLEADLWHWIVTTPAVVVNHPTPSASNGTKPIQTQAAAACGFRVPHSLVTNDFGALRAFAQRHGTLVVKAAGGSRTFTNVVDLTDTDRLERLRTCPTYFQQLIVGRNVRVHVVGSEIFPVEVCSEEIDYRRGATDMYRIALPTSIAAMCLKVATKLRLLLAGLDLIRTPAGDWYFLEANPAPAFTYYPDHQDVASAIADLLMTHRRVAPPRRSHYRPVAS